MFYLAQPEMFLNDFCMPSLLNRSGASIVDASMPAYIQQLHHGKMPIQLSMCKTRVDKLDEIDPESASRVSLHKHFLEDLVTDDEGRVVGYDMSAGPPVEYSPYAELYVGHVHCCGWACATISHD
jgi:hypothetical protein